MSLLIRCPHCLIPAEDGWEVLDEGKVTDLKCSYCQKKYSFLIVECSRCGEDNVIVEVSNASARGRKCQNCDCTLEDERQDGETDFI
jgi:DNA-directed RNA polymerase subunit RPC12/RpoP